MLPHEGSIGVIGLVGPFLGLDKAALDDLPYHHFKGLAVALVQGQQEARQHGEHHNQGRRAASHPAPEQKIKRDAYEKRTAEADQLPLRQVESDLRFNFCQVLGDRNIGHKITLSIGQWALNADFAMLLVLKSVKHSSTV